MPRFAANLTFLFTELPMLQRFAAARRAGFRGVEVLFPYDLSTRDLTKAAQTEGLEFVLINAPPPNWAGGPRGFAALPGGEERFRRDFERALRHAQELRALHIHVMAGAAEGATARQTFTENLRWACERAPHASLTIEPLNSLDMPGYFLRDFDQAAEIIDAVGCPNLGLQFDAYHAQIITGDVAATWAAHAARTRHVQIASVPGRHEPGPGPVDFPGFFRAVDASGYAGWISAEYNPRITTEAGIGWLADMTR
ncbi:TIM barrel protein [Paracoccus sp. Z118]|uniref:hydroxypyruvate isomerase family protein n=1 Tax=Paracoccus sp. Z118 TaxID=2851017 RepID=UPI001C2BC7AF|nr:TIM barrel protein [Paracoccus sp. Z118]MBV0891647.1 TIM barrel protein [Paracoccus sp. Z118]